MAISLNKVYKFNTIAPGILGATFENMKVVGIINYKEALLFEDIISIHTKVTTTVTNVSLPMDYQDCTYVKFENGSGLTKILALEYIQADSIVEIQTKKLIITINNFSDQDPTIVSNALKDLGYWDFAVKTE